MANDFNCVAEICIEKKSWKIQARVVQLWVATNLGNQKIPFSMELVLMDDEV